MDNEMKNETKEKIKVVVADDQRFARMYVDMQIKTSPRYEVVASLPLAGDVVEYLKDHDADLVILDVVMERGEDGITAAAKIKKTHPQTKIILCTSMAEKEWMERAKQIGVESFWYKEYSRIPLLEIMDRTVSGESVYSDEVPEIYLGKLPVSRLSAQQKEVLRYLIIGMTNREIANAMYLSPNTVKSYIDDLMSDTDIHSRTELAVRASKLGLSVNSGDTD